MAEHAFRECEEKRVQWQGYQIWGEKGGGANMRGVISSLHDDCNFDVFNFDDFNYADFNFDDFNFEF